MKEQDRPRIVGWMDSTAFDQHENGFDHPERPERLHAIRKRFAKSGLDDQLVLTTPPPVKPAVLESIHTKGYIRRVKDLSDTIGGQIDPDTAVGPGSWLASQLAVGSVVNSAQRVLSKEWNRAFCSVRPPGHHACSDHGMGFCLFNNVAIGAQSVIAKGSVQRVAILDWDVHHGNGTQDLFWNRGDVLYASWHQEHIFPFSGRADEQGDGDGLGATVNCPLAAGAGESEFLEAWERVIRPALEHHRPELVFVSAGFDADYRDPLASLRMTPTGFQHLSEAVVEFVDMHCQGRLVSVLEGGYNTDALAEDVEAHAKTLL